MTRERFKNLTPGSEIVIKGITGYFAVLYQPMPEPGLTGNLKTAAVRIDGPTAGGTVLGLTRADITRATGHVVNLDSLTRAPQALLETLSHDAALAYAGAYRQILDLAPEQRRTVALSIAKAERGTIENLHRMFPTSDQQFIRGYRMAWGRIRGAEAAVARDTADGVKRVVVLGDLPGDVR